MPFGNWTVVQMFEAVFGNIKFNACQPLKPVEPSVGKNFTPCHFFIEFHFHRTLETIVMYSSISQPPKPVPLAGLNKFVTRPN